MAFEKVKRIAKETGEKLIGRGQEVQFRKDAEKLATSTGISIERAQKTLTQNRFKDLHTQIVTDGYLDPTSQEWRRVLAAVKETISQKSLENCQTEALNSAHFHGITLRPDTIRVKNALIAKYKKEYTDAGKTINQNQTLSNLNAEGIEWLRQMSARLETILGRNVRNANSLESIISSDPVMQAQLGKMIEAHTLCKKSENSILRKLIFEKSRQKLRQDYHEAIFNHFFPGVHKFCKSLGSALSGAMRGNFDPFFRYIGTSLQLTGSFIWGAGKLTFKTIGTTGRYIQSIK